MDVRKKVGLFWALTAIALLTVAAVERPLFGAEPPDLDQSARLLADAKADTKARMEAAKKLGQAKDSKYLQVLTEALTDNHKAIRWTAAEALWDLRDPRAVPALIEYLEKGEAYEWGKVITMDALGSFKDPRAVEPLIGVLQSRNPFLRRSAAVALFTIGDDRAIPALIELLKDEQGFIRRIAQNFLVEMTREKMTGEPPMEYSEWVKWYQSNSHRLRIEGRKQQ